eukprot:symbB.v1.2.003216.t1/scaffold166.1/size289592/18
MIFSSKLQGVPKRRRGATIAATNPFAAKAAEEADLFLAPLGAKGIKLHIQSGEGDCGVSTFLPQDAMPKAIFPRCTRSGNLELWRNPSDHCIDGVQVVGHAGQPLALASRAQKAASHLEMLLQSWQTQYLAPLWPELLMKAESTSTAAERQPDPFVIQERSEASKVLLFSGNSSAAWELLPGIESAEPQGQKDVLAVCVPSFEKEPSVLLVDLKDLSVQQLRFSVS